MRPTTWESSWKKFIIIVKWHYLAGTGWRSPRTSSVSSRAPSSRQTVWRRSWRRGRWWTWTPAGLTVGEKNVMSSGEHDKQWCHQRNTTHSDVIRGTRQTVMSSEEHDTQWCHQRNTTNSDVIKGTRQTVRSSKEHDKQWGHQRNTTNSDVIRGTRQTMMSSEEHDKQWCHYRNTTNSDVIRGTRHTVMSSEEHDKQWCHQRNTTNGDVIRGTRHTVTSSEEHDKQWCHQRNTTNSDVIRGTQVVSSEEHKWCHQRNTTTVMSLQELDKHIERNIEARQKETMSTQDLLHGSASSSSIRGIIIFSSSTCCPLLSVCSLSVDDLPTLSI